MRRETVLFCFACAGASALPFLGWSRYAPCTVKIVPVERPGRGRLSGIDHLHDFAMLIDDLCDRLVRNGIPPRFAMFGHSLGALIAYACAHELRRRCIGGLQTLLVAASNAPSRRDDERFLSMGRDAQLIGELRRQRGTPEEVFADESLLALTLKAFRADLDVCTSYRPRDVRRLDVPIYVYGGSEDDIDQATLHAWSLETSAQAEVRYLPGGHFFHRGNEPAFVRLLCAHLSEEQTDDEQS